MSETQFEKMINHVKMLEQKNKRLQAENERLRGLLREFVSDSYWDDEYILVPHELSKKIEKEVSYE